jgi:hypothetical protein
MERQMPFKSKAQRRKFAQLLVEGRISDETYEEWNRSTGRKTLPERAGKKAGRKTASAKKSAGRKKAATKTGPRKKTKSRAAKR